MDIKFELETAIKQWRKSLNRNEALEDGAKEELESHLRDKIDYLVNQGYSPSKAFQEALDKIGSRDLLGMEYYKSTTRKLSRRPPWKQSRWVPPLLSNYFRIGLRKIYRQRLYALTNIIGLAVGLACCAVIILYVVNEVTYDSFYPDADRIYRIATYRKNQVGESWWATSPSPLKTALTDSFPQVELSSRVTPPPENSAHVLVVRNEKRFFENRIFFIDNELFEVFKVPFLKGSSAAALTEPNTVVITTEMAEKYFFDEDPLDQTLQIEIDYDTGRVELQDYRVTGVIKNSPSNSHFKYDMLLSMSTVPLNRPDFETEWLGFHGNYTYVKLNETADIKEFEKNIQLLAQTHIIEPSRETRYKQDRCEFILQPVSRIHMHSRYSQEISTPGNWYYIYVYSIAAFLILLIGCMNFINLSAALSTTRTREVSLRKVVGARNGQLIRQFIGESFLITMIAFSIAIGLMTLLLIPFNQMAGTELSLAGLTRPLVFLSVLGLLCCVAVGSGGYPAFILSAYQPAAVLQGKSSSTARGALVQRVLVIGQFAISIFLVICTITVFKQLDFMKGRALGFDLQQKMLIRVKSNLPHLRRDYEEIKNDFLQHPSILGMTVSSSVPGDDVQSGYYMTTTQDFRDASRLKVITMDYDFISEYGIKMLTGRPFDRSAGNDEQGAYLINLAGVKALGFNSPEEAIGKSFMAHYHRQTKQIVGITDNFHFRGMREVVEPLILDIEPSLMNTITLRIKIENMSDIMRFVDQKWRDHFPGVPFEYGFLDENFAREYFYEEQMGRLLSIIASLGFIIACLGLFGLSAFVVRYRTKEIGIRKVLGASNHNIISMLSKKFLWLIFIAILVASPLAFYAMNAWLQDFAYRIDFNLVVFLIVAAGAIGVSMATVGVQGFRAASANPVNSLRDE